MAGAQGGPPTPDTTITLSCKDEVKMFQIFPGPQDFPEIDTEIVEIITQPCVPLNLKNPIYFNGLCAEGNFTVEDGNSCNILVTPKSSCILQTSNTTGAHFSGQTKHGTVIDGIWVDFVWPLSSMNSSPQNKPNLPKKLYAVLYDGSWNQKAIDSFDVNIKYTKDSSGLVEFTFDKYFDANKGFHILVYGTDPLYNDPNNPAIWEFYGFKIEFLCSALGNFCQWGPAKKVWEEYDGCEKNSYYEWISGCGDSYVAKYVFTDRDAPVVLNKPQDVTIYVNKIDCEAEYIVPAILFDDCDKYASVLITSPYGDIRGNGGILSGIRVGIKKFFVTYTITDGCGNSTQCSYWVNVKELNDFSLVCKGSTIVSLNDSCNFVTAKTFVVGTTGLCCNSYTVIGMRMDDGKAGKNIKFCCADVGKKVMVMLTAISDCDSTVRNSCMVEVEVQNKMSPRIYCPADMTVSCDALDLSNLSKYGKPTVFANCGYSLKDTFSVNLDDCKAGTIIRTFTATGSNGLTTLCSQTIIVLNLNPLKGSDIVWPKDTTLYDCHATYDQAKTGSPSMNILYKGCSKALYAHSDQVFFAGKNGICKKILRTWKAFDCCYPYNTPWQQVQVITLRDSVKPVITFCPKDTSAPNFGACTDSVLVNLESLTATDCAGILRITNDSKYSFAKGANASGRYPNGVHRVVFTVYDSCGSISTCSMTITVSDKKAPSLFCISIATDLQNCPPMGIGAKVAVNQFILKKEDNCCPSDRIIASFSKDSLVDTLYFDCSQIGLNVVEVWITDCNGNQEVCKPTIDIQDNFKLCPPTFKDTLMVAGALERPNGSLVEEVKITLDSTSMICSGLYKFDSLAPVTHKVTPWKDDDPMEGVSTKDLVKIQRYLLGLDTLSKFQLIAADVTKSNSVTTADISEIRKMILGVIPNFTKNTSWRFVPKAYKFPAGPMTWGFPESLNVGYGSPPGDVMDADFWGIKIGDVSGSSNTLKDDQEYEFLFIDGKYLPESEKVLLEIPKEFGKSTITIVDLRGIVKTTLQNDKSGVILDLEKYPSGIYLVSVSTEKWDEPYFIKVLKL